MAHVLYNLKYIYLQGHQGKSPFPRIARLHVIFTLVYNL
jgi:hypothetical protein